uniref:Uncharacterized protein n=1 Tax=Cantharellus cibarius TaxID=36066 RepID=A0A2S0S4A7_CANCI|nr:hypothetical protein [Cantharellus cibarius]AWA82185.1 hypothetical protein [Cantharellus cibarius]
MERKFNNITDIDNLQIFAAFSRAIHIEVDKEPKTEYQVIASTFFTNRKNVSSIKWGNMVSKMENFGWMRLIIVRISQKYTQSYEEILSNSIYMDIKMVFVSIDEFFTEHWINTLIIDNKFHNQDIIYNFIGIDWHEILIRFKINNIRISGGSTTKRHILSPVQLRLGQFITLTFGVNHSNAIESFQIANNKSLTRPIYDLTSKDSHLLIEEYKEKMREERIKELDIKKETEVNKQSITGEIELSKSGPSTNNLNSLQKREYHSSSRLQVSDSSLSSELFWNNNNYRQ